MLFGSALGFGSLGLGAVGSGRVLGIGTGQTLVEGCERRHGLAKGVSLPELEVGATLKELAHTLGFLDTRHFYHNLAYLALAAQDLNVGLCHTKTVDTRAYHLVGVFNGCIHLLVEHLLHVGVARVVRDVLLAKL